jgi:type III pantothenate kinase
MIGYAGMVKAIIERTEQELGREVFVIATGGLSQTILP